MRRRVLERRDAQRHVRVRRVDRSARSSSRAFLSQGALLVRIDRRMEEHCITRTRRRPSCRSSTCRPGRTCRDRVSRALEPASHSGVECAYKLSGGNLMRRLMLRSYSDCMLRTRVCPGSRRGRPRSRRRRPASAAPGRNEPSCGMGGQARPADRPDDESQVRANGERLPLYDRTGRSVLPAFSDGQRAYSVKATFTQTTPSNFPEGYGLVHRRDRSSGPEAAVHLLSCSPGRTVHHQAARRS